MKFLIVTLLFLSSVPAFAISDQNLVSTCAPTGKTKLAKQAAAYGCEIDVEHMSVDAIDNRPAESIKIRLVQSRSTLWRVC